MPGRGARDDVDVQIDPANPLMRCRKGRKAVVNNVQKESVKHGACFDVAPHSEVVGRLCTEGPYWNLPVRPAFEVFGCCVADKATADFEVYVV